MAATLLLLQAAAHMHQALFIREILLHVFGYCSILASNRNHKADLAALARTCRTFKEPALDVLWEQLSNLSPLARCLPEACKLDRYCYSFSRPLTEAEWNTLQGYTRRVRSICQDTTASDDRIACALASFTDPLFPNLQSLFWNDLTILPVAHIAVPSLTSLNLNFLHSSDRILPTEFLDILGERCPNIRRFAAFSPRPGTLFPTISRQLSRWANLQHVHCRLVALSMDTILNLPSMSTLSSFGFTLSAHPGDHTTHLGSPFVFSNLTDLEVISTSLKSVTSLFSRIRLPKIKDLRVFVSEYAPKWDVREYWMAVQKACPSNTLTRLAFSCSGKGIENSTDVDEQRGPWLRLDDLLPYKEFGSLRLININVPWSVDLTDSDILDLVSTSPQLEGLSINYYWGWRMEGDGGGITLSGLLALLRRCPFLSLVALAIDTRTFAEIPDDLDVSFSPRGLRGRASLDYLDSDIGPEEAPDFESVLFTTLGLLAYSSLHPDHSSSGDISQDDGDA